MDYILVLALLVVVPIVLVFLFMRRPTHAGGARPHDRGVTPSEPAADQPTPGADAINEVVPGREKRIPPG